jgi:hypothetical protein
MLTLLAWTLLFVCAVVAVYLIGGRLERIQRSRRPRLQLAMLGFDVLGPSGRECSVAALTPCRPAPECERLEIRIVPAVLVNTWTDVTQDHLFSDNLNWTLGRKPIATDIVQYDKNVSNDACTVDVPAYVGGLQFINGYSSYVTIGNNNILQVQPVAGGVTDWTNGGTTVKFQMGNAASTIELDAGGTFMYFRVQGPLVGGQPTPGGKLDLGNGTFTDPTAIVTCWADVEIGYGAVFNLNTNNFLGFDVTDGAKLTVDSGGTLALGDSDGGAVLGSDTNGYIENSGTITWTLNSGTHNTRVGAPLLNHGTLTIDSNGGNVGLEFGGQSTFTSGYAVKMDSGSLTLKRHGQITVTSGYYQTGGSFLTDNSSSVALYLNNANRVAEFDGGLIMLADSTHFQNFYIQGSNGTTTDTVNLKGVHLWMKVRGNFSNDNDLLACQNGTVNIDPVASWLFVSNTLGGAVQAGKFWDIISAANITGDFTTKDFTDFAPGITRSGRVQNSTLYELGS